jgi:hypothetical protein
MGIFAGESSESRAIYDGAILRKAQFIGKPGLIEINCWEALQTFFHQYVI